MKTENRQAALHPRGGGPQAAALPATRDEMLARGWTELDVLIVTGDAYVDHPSFGAAMIARVLEAEGLRVGVVAQPDWRTPASLQAMGRPRLFCGVTAGNLDSMLANYTAARHKRREDDYSAGGLPGRRPNHAAVVYAQLAQRRVPRTAGRARRDRGQPAARGALRLLGGQAAAVDPRRLQGGPARVRHGRERRSGNRPPAERRRRVREPPPTSPASAAPPASSAPTPPAPCRSPGAVVLPGWEELQAEQDPAAGGHQARRGRAEPPLRPAAGAVPRRARGGRRAPCPAAARERSWTPSTTCRSRGCRTRPTRRRSRHSR